MLSLSELGATASYPYTCNATICYGTGGGATHALFKETQYQMNRAGRGLIPAWRAISVDGFIGSETVAAAKLLFPRLGAFIKYANPASFSQLAGWIAADPQLFGAGLRQAADGATGSQVAESPAKVEARVDAFTKEGPAKTTPAATTQPDIKIPSPNVTAPSPGTPEAIVGPGPAARPPAQKGGAIVWVVAGVAVVGLVSAAVYAKRRRRS